MSEKKKIRLLMISPSFGGGGAERVAVHLLNYLDESKYETLVVIFEERYDYFKDLNKPTNFVCLHKKGRMDFFRLVIRVSKIMREFNPSVVISILHYFNLVCGCAALFVRKNFILIFCEHSFHRSFLSSGRCGSLKKMMMHFIYKRANHVVAISERMRQALIEDFGLEKNKVVKIYNPLPLDEIRRCASESINHLFFEDGHAVIISVGRLDFPKRFDRLLEALALVREKRKDVYLLILGQGEQLSSLQNLAKQLGISAFVEFVGFQSNPYAWMKKSDLFVLSSDYEGFPMVLIEAMACGTSVISSDCPSGPDEIIENGTNGLLVKLEDKDALVKAMCAILDNTESRNRMAQAGEQSVSRFGVNIIIPQYESLWL